MQASLSRPVAHAASGRTGSCVDRARDSLRLSTLVRPIAGRVGLGLLCLAVLAASNAAYAYLTGPLLKFALGGASELAFGPRLPIAWATSRASAVVAVLCLLLCLAAVKGLAHYGQLVLLEGAAERTGHRLRVRLYGHLLRIPLRVWRKHSTGDLLSRLLDDVRRVQHALLGSAIALVRDGLAAVALLLTAVVLAPRLAWVGVLVLPVIALTILYLARRVRRSASRSQDELGMLSARAHQGLVALREVKSCGAEQRELSQFAEHSRAAADWALSRIRARAVSPLVNEVLAALGLGALLVVTTRSIEGGADSARLLSLFAAVVMMYRPIRGLGQAAHLWAVGQASASRVAVLLKEAIEPELAGCPPARSLSTGSQPIIEARGLCYTYPNGCSPLRGVDLRLGPGRLICVAGESGAGKSTLADILCGLERADAGQLLIDGKDYNRRPLRALRDLVAVVPQLPLLFEGTIADNLRYGNPQATKREMNAALEAASLRGRIEALPAGLHTVLGSRGCQLSVGERQRLSIARALLRPGALLVLDEPSSALDSENEARLVQSLRRVKKERAVLVIAHSPRLLASADEVLHLEQGKLRTTRPENAT